MNPNRLPLSDNSILHLKQSRKRLRLRQRRSTITITHWGAMRESLTSVDTPPVVATAVAKVELGWDVCVDPVPFTRYGCAGIVWVRVDGLAGLEGEVGLEGPGYG